jgi:hypothetical protein
MAQSATPPQVHHEVILDRAFGVDSPNVEHLAVVLEIVATGDSC